MTIVDTIFKALAPAIPDRVIAGHHADLAGVVVPRHQYRAPREFFIGSFGPLGGGWGAKHDEDGVSGTVCINDGDTHNSPNEQAEAKFPIVVERYALVPDSGGAGRHRGGLGVERVVRARSHIMVNTQIDRAHCRPWGLDGGLEGTGNEVAIRVGGAMEDRLPQRQGAGGAAQARRRLPHPLGRRRRLRRPARAADRAGARGRAAGLCVGERRRPSTTAWWSIRRRSRSTWRRRKSCAPRGGQVMARQQRSLHSSQRPASAFRLRRTPNAFWRNEPNWHFANKSKRAKAPIHIHLSNSQRFAARGLGFSGAGRRPFPFSFSLARKGNGAPGGAGCVASAPWRTLRGSAARRCDPARAPQ